MGGRACVPDESIAHVRRGRGLPGAGAHHRAAWGPGRIRQPAPGRAAGGPGGSTAQKHRRAGVDRDRRGCAGRGAGAPVPRAREQGPRCPTNLLACRRVLSAAVRGRERRSARRSPARARDGFGVVRTQPAGDRRRRGRPGGRDQVLPGGDDPRPAAGASDPLCARALRGAFARHRRHLHPARRRRHAFLLPARPAAVARLAQPGLRVRLGADSLHAHDRR